MKLRKLLRALPANAPLFDSASPNWAWEVLKLLDLEGEAPSQSRMEQLDQFLRMCLFPTETRCSGNHGAPWRYGIVFKDRASAVHCMGGNKVECNCGHVESI